MTTNNSLNAPLPLSIAQGGTNNSATPATGGVVYFDGTQLNTTSFVTMGTNGIFLGNSTFGFQGNLNQDRYRLLDHTNGSKIANSGVGSTFSFDSYAGLFTSAGGGVSTGQYAWKTVDSSGAAWQTVMTLSNSGVLNLSNLTASSTVFTDSSKNLTSSGTVAQANGGTNNSSAYNANALIYQNSGNTAFTSGSDLTYSSNVLAISTSNATPQISIATSTSGSSNSSSLVLRRGDLTNGSNIIYFQTTASTTDWLIREIANSSDLTFTSFNASKEVLTLGLSTYNATLPNGNLIFSTATAGLQFTHAALSGSTANSVLVTGITLTTGSSGTINNSAVTTSHLGIPIITSRGGTILPVSVVCSSGSFVATGGGLDTSTYAILFIKSL